MTTAPRRLLVLGDPVIPMTPGAPAIERGAVLVENGVVTAVGPRAEVAAHVAAAGVARQKTPGRLEIVAQLPRNASGKVRKFELRARLGKEAAR